MPDVKVPNSKRRKLPEHFVDRHPARRFCTRRHKIECFQFGIDLPPNWWWFDLNGKTVCRSKFTHVEHGSWVVLQDNGGIDVMTDDVFRMKYEEVR